MIKALGLDQAPNNTGWAVGTPDMTSPVWGHWKLRPWGNNEGERLNEFEDRLSDLLDRYKVTHVFREQLYPIISPRDWDTRENQSKVVGAIESMCARRKLPLFQVLIKDWRMRFLGTASVPGLKGDKAREELKRMALAACGKRSWWVDNPDAAEACGILNYGLGSLDPAYERRDQPLMRRAESAADEKWRVRA